MTPTVHLAVSQLAVSEDKVTPGLLGFMVVVVIGLATWLLLRSMTRHMKKVDFEEQPPTEKKPKAKVGAPASSPENTSDSSKQ